ncbi:MAG TPA: UDP-N-acetylglucosamine 2-epimerase (non-hydrolyzing), partial [Syntrophobacteraceae bacterium]|nr:UDP-N-acetylglucosamine 2-epimerase (non-hydrolyzing) [Syntrophobacteraceae bacterium]
RELDIPKPDYHLGIGSGAHGWQTGAMLSAIEPVLLAEQPHGVVVYGDTNSTLAGALAAAKLNMLNAHVEAGLRSFNRRMPEETNRVVADHVADLLFAPTTTAKKNLLNEGVREADIHLVGDVMYDAALYYGSKSEKESRILSRLEVEPKEYVLATVHRAENTDNANCLRAIFEGLMQVSRDTVVVLPLHPRTRKALEREGLLLRAADALKLIEPVGYLDMVMLEKNAKVVVTDSGGVQKEAFFYEVPCVTVREETEWVELIELGWNRLAPPTGSASLADAVSEAAARAPGSWESPYGNGRSAEKIVEILIDRAGR